MAYRPVRFQQPSKAGLMVQAAANFDRVEGNFGLLSAGLEAMLAA